MSSRLLGPPLARESGTGRYVLMVDHRARVADARSFNRSVAYATGMANIRDVIPFPRTPGSADFQQPASARREGRAESLHAPRGVR